MQAGINTVPYKHQQSSTNIRSATVLPRSGSTGCTLCSLILEWVHLSLPSFSSWNQQLFLSEVIRNANKYSEQAQEVFNISSKAFLGTPECQHPWTLALALFSVQDRILVFNVPKVNLFAGPGMKGQQDMGFKDTNINQRTTKSVGLGSLG